MKKQISAILVCGMFFTLICTSCGNNNKNNVDGKENYIIYDIDFPEYAGELQPNITTKVNMDIPEMDSLVTYIAKENKITDSDKEKLCDIFEVDIKKAKEDDVHTVIEENNKRLSIYDKGNYEYSNGKNSESKVQFDDAKAVNIAESYLREKGLLPNGFEYAGIGIGELVIGKKSIVNEKTVFFNRFIDGKEVEGDACIMVTLIGDGEITKVISSYNDEIKKETVDERNIISVEDALKDIVNLKNFLDIDEEADELEINNVSIRYWEESSPYEDKAYVQPVYEVTGKQYKNGKDKGEFRIITQAIKNS